MAQANSIALVSPTASPAFPLPCARQLPDGSKSETSSALRTAHPFRLRRNPVPKTTVLPRLADVRPILRPFASKIRVRVSPLTSRDSQFSVHSSDSPDLAPIHVAQSSRKKSPTDVRCQPQWLFRDRSLDKHDRAPPSETKPPSASAQPRSPDSSCNSNSSSKSYCRASLRRHIVRVLSSLAHATPAEFRSRQIAPR